MAATIFRHFAIDPPWSLAAAFGATRKALRVAPGRMSAQPASMDPDFQAPAPEKGSVVFGRAGNPLTPR